MSGGRVALAVLGPITRGLSALVPRLPAAGGAEVARQLCAAAGGKGANPAFAAS
jgi:hypothetical protein